MQNNRRNFSNKPLPMNTTNWKSDLVALVTFGVIFYISAYFSVSDLLPSSIPVHHDDYTNYAAGSVDWSWSWNRPLSTMLIHVLTQINPELLIWCVRLLTVTFVFFVWKLTCELYYPTYYWITLFLFAAGTLSLPVIVEYARYTGMVTHLLSGCFGMSSVYFLFREVRLPKQGYIYVSLVLLVLSALAKEDFVLFYAVSLTYAFLLTNRKTLLAWGLAGLGVCALLIINAKFIAASSFLGESSAGSAYYINISLSSVFNTVWLYLSGAGHPAIADHGVIVSSLFVFVLLTAVGLTIYNKKVPVTAYFSVAILSIIAPYSVLPNHVNAYYEFLWLPMIIASGYIAVTELMKATASSSLVLNKFISITVFLSIISTFIIIDYPGRKSIAAWYDSIGLSNSKVFELLQSKKEKINEADDVCIIGANSFSPWYMHDGIYLEKVLNLNAKWYVFVEKKSSYYPGMITGRNKNKEIISEQSKMNSISCVEINVGDAG